MRSSGRIFLQRERESRFFYCLLFGRRAGRYGKFGGKGACKEQGNFFADSLLTVPDGMSAEHQFFC